MKKKLMMVIMGLVSLVAVGIFSNETAAAAGIDDPQVAIFRLYNASTGEHLFTPRSEERTNLINIGWVDEGVGFTVPYTESTPYVYRLYNPNNSDHHYTTSFEENLALQAIGWQEDLVGFYTATSDAMPVYRLFNPNATVATHHFTLNNDERANLVQLGWIYEGVAFYANSI